MRRIYRTSHYPLTENVTDIAKSTGLDYVQIGDITELLETHGEKLPEQLSKINPNESEAHCNSGWDTNSEINAKGYCSY